MGLCESDLHDLNASLNPNMLEQIRSLAPTSNSLKAEITPPGNNGHSRRRSIVHQRKENRHQVLTSCLPDLPQTVVTLISQYDGLTMTGNCVLVLKGHTSAITCLCPMRHGLLASGSNDNTVRVWKLKSGKCVRVLDEHTGPITALTALPELRLVSCSKDWDVKVWDVEHAKCLSTLVGHSDAVTAVVPLSANHLATASLDCTIRIWDISIVPFVAGQCTKVLHAGEKQGVCALALLGKNRLISSAHGGVIKIWDLETAACLKTLERVTPPPEPALSSTSASDAISNSSLASSPAAASSCCLSCSTASSSSSHANSKQSEKQAPAARATVISLAVLPSQEFFTGSWDKKVALWKPKLSPKFRSSRDNRTNSGIASGAGSVTASSMSLQGIAEVSSTSSTTSATASPTPIHPSRTSTDMSQPVSRSISATTQAATANGTAPSTVGGSMGLTSTTSDSATASAKQRTHSRTTSGTPFKPDAVCLQQMDTLADQSEWMNTVALLSDSLLACGAMSGAIEVWNWSTKECLRTFTAHENNMRCMTVLPDGRLASGSTDHLIKIWA